MFNDAEGGGGGGFFNAETSFAGGSPQVPKKGDQKRAQNIMPVTARQVCNSPDDGLQIGNINVYLVTLVGLVRSIENTSVKVTYLLEDDTGCIEGVHWIDGDENATTQPVVLENTYCRLSGTIRTHSEKHYIMVFNIQQLEDLNEITSHRLEVALFSKKESMTNAPEGPVAGGSGVYENGVGTSNGLSNSLITTSNHGTISGLTSIQQQVLTVIQQCALESGIDVNDILPQMGSNATRADITAAVEFLSGEGHIYTTIDDNHYRTTDSA